jgi:hypothetical protein
VVRVHYAPLGISAGQSRYSSARKVGDILADIGFGPHLVHIDEIPGV